MAAIDKLADGLHARFKDRIRTLEQEHGEITVELAAEDLFDTCTALRDEPQFRFECLMDLCGVDYSAYGEAEWKTDMATDTGFSRGVDRRLFTGEETPVDEPRFAVVYHLLSVSLNHRLRLRVFAPDNDFPAVDSVNSIWNSANWFEREAFDLYGILFAGHPDLRRLLTDYGFIGHPFRKDFPLSGHVEVRYDPEKQRVVYEPVSIEPRVLVPRVIREDHRYEGRKPEGNAADA